MKTEYSDEDLNLNKSLIEEEKTHENYEKFLKEVRSNMSKCKYRKVLEDIQVKLGIFDSIKESWKLKEIRIKCILKIVNRKLHKYENNFQKQKSIENWLNKVEWEINEWFEDVGKDDQDQEQIEVIIQLLLEYFHSFAVLYKNEKCIAESIGYLAMGEKIIKVYIEVSRDPKTLNLAQKILLFLSSMLIVDLDFETAKVYQSSALKLAFKELFFRVDIEDGVNIETFSRVNQHYLNKLFVNIILAFYHRGVCEENNGNYPKAAEAYKQAKWFIIKFLKNYIPELSQFISDVEEKSVGYAKIFLKSNGVIFEYKPLDNKDTINNMHALNKGAKSKVIQNNNTLLEENKASNQFEFLKKKYSKTINLIQNLKFPEFENDFKKGDDNLKDILYTVKTVNNLMSNKFKNIVQKMDNLEIHKLNKDSIDIIQRRINDVKAEENYLKNLCKGNYLKRNKSENFILQENNSILKNSLDRIDNLHNEQKFTQNHIILPDDALEFIKEKKDKIKIVKENLTMKKSRSQMDLTLKTKIIKKDIEKTERFIYDEYISNKKFQRKFSQLNNLSVRELKFQKKILNLKKFENDSIPNVNVNNIDNIHKANLLVRMRNGTKILNYNEDIKQNKSEDVILRKKKQEKDKEKLELNVVKSLDKKAFRDYKKFESKMNTPKFQIREEFAIKNNSQNDYMKIILDNDEIMSKIDKELVFYDYVENENLKAINPLKFKEKKQTQRKLISQNYLPHKSMEHFILKNKQSRSPKSNTTQIKRNNFERTSTNNNINLS